MLTFRPELAVGVLPLDHPAAGLPEHPAAKRVNLPALLGDRDEAVRHDQALGGVHPADQRLHPDHARRLHLDDGLEVEDELLPVGGSLQVQLELEPLRERLVHVALEDLVAALPLALGLVHRQVGVAEQVLGLLQPDRDPDAAGDEHLAALDLDHPLDRVEGEARHPGDLDRLTDVLDEDRELIAAEPGDGVRRSHHRGEPLPDDDQQLVPGGVPEAVVDRLEAVQVGEQHAHRVARRLGAGARLREAVDEEGAVREAGERVVEGLVGGLLGGLRVVQRQAGVLGKREDGVTLDLAVSATRAARAEGERADELSALVDGRRDHRPEPVDDDVRHPAGIRAVVLDDDRPLLRHGVPGDADLHRCAPKLVEQLRRVADGCHHLEHRRVLRIDQAEVHQLVPQQLARTRDDRVQDILDVGAAGDRALQQREPLEQGLALAKLADQPDASQRQSEDASHPAKEVQLLLAEVLAPRPRDEQRALFADQRAHPGAEAEVAERALESQIAGRLDQVGDGLLTRRKADRGGDLPSRIRAAISVPMAAAARSTQPCRASCSSVKEETTERNSASCRVVQLSAWKLSGPLPVRVG